ncbi:MAG TPA: hypothetical protein DCE41_25630 [Cytophagales bacterium]|nr:hypothetical protein [Cytophagales bacterium]HAA19920.1 hypothetical protein [Cytophagales bacterium]HAP62652.1 hypothetical protein [Cytophagales bacterium]
MGLQSFFSDYALYGSFILLLICVAGVVIFPIIQSLSNPRMLIKPLIGLVLVGLLYFIGYQINAGVGVSNGFTNLADAFPTMTQTEAEVAAANVTRNVGAAFFVTYILGGVAIVGIFFTELAKYFR